MATAPGPTSARPDINKPHFLEFVVTPRDHTGKDNDLDITVLNVNEDPLVGVPLGVRYEGKDISGLVTAAGGYIHHLMHVDRDTYLRVMIDRDDVAMSDQHPVTVHDDRPKPPKPKL